MIKDSRHTSRIEEDKSTQEDNTVIQEYSLIEQAKKGNVSENRKDSNNLSVLNDNKQSESFELRKDKLEILEQNINKIREEN